MRIIFMGTPAFAVPALNALVAAGHHVCGVFSQPDRPKGRGMKLQPTPVKICAQTHDIPVYQPEVLQDGAAFEAVRKWDPELIVVAAYGRLLPDEILNYPSMGCINIHSSLLPHYRGAAPINWAVLNGEPETGVTIMHMAHELDAGDIIDQIVTPIDPNENADHLYFRLAELGGGLLIKVVKALGAGGADRTPQDTTQVSYAPMLNKALSPMDWTHDTQSLHNQVRGLLPWPVASTDVLNGDTVRIYQTMIVGETANAKPGTVVSAGKQGIDVTCGDGGILRILELQATGGKRMQSSDYLRGHPLAL